MINYQLPNHSFQSQSYSVYYHPRHDLIGLDVGQGVIRVYLQDDARTYIPKTDAWVFIGNL